YPLSDGEVEERVQKLQFEGFGPVAKRQQSPHIHQVRFLPKMEGMEGYWILAPDLGSDKVRVIRYIPNRENGPFLSHFGDIPFPPGSGPRHLDFDPVKGMMYCLSELSGELVVFKISADAGGEPVFEQVQTVLADECRSGGSGDIHIHPSGKYLYTSHRLKNDGLAVFRVCDDGTIRKSGYVHTKDHPRSFLITPDGRHILVASKNDLSIEVFLVDGDGMPVPTGCIASLSPDAPTAIAICK
ncbi:MAG: beta-propeller fold lactonase family protein, partial [Bacteroidales bacterium]|nr:beta-propeller fold lactonase family protein [Bacteroidales bacterium]